MTQSCRQTQTADSGGGGGKGFYQRIPIARQQESALEGGWYKEETVGWKGNRVWGWAKEEWVWGWWGELFISGTLLQFHSGNDGNIPRSQTQSGRCMVIMSGKECQICAWERSCDLRAAGIMGQNPTDPEEAHTPISDTYTHHILMVLHQAQIHPT